jgi:hypothetical protein
MPFIPVENVALIEVRMLLDDQKVENTLYAQSVDALDGARLSSMANVVKDWWTDQYGPLVSDLVTLREVTCTDLTTATGSQVSVSGGLAPGGQIGGSEPSNVSLAISFRTTLRGRAFRGRNYIVGIPLERMASQNEVESTFASDLTSAYIQLREDLDSADFTWVVVSRFSGVDPETGDPIPREAGVATPVLAPLVTDLTVDSQRRRLPGRGQ